MVDFRYFVVTLVTVFLSLALGLFIGANLPSDEGLWARQDSLIASLEREFQALRAESRSLHAQTLSIEQILNSERQLTQTLLMPLLANQLLDRSIIVWELGSTDLSDEVMELLWASGAQVRYAKTSGEMLQYPWQEVDSIVLLANAPKDIAAQQAVIDQLLLADAHVVGASCIRITGDGPGLYLHQRIPWVDHAESPSGQLSLLYLLLGFEDEGGFGWGDGQRSWPHPAFLYGEGYRD